MEGRSVQPWTGMHTRARPRGACQLRSRTMNPGGYLNGGKVGGVGIPEWDPGKGLWRQRAGR